MVEFWRGLGFGIEFSLSIAVKGGCGIHLADLEACTVAICGLLAIKPADKDSLAVDQSDNETGGY